MRRVKIKKQECSQLLMAGLLLVLVLISLRSFLILHTVWAAGAASLASTIYIIFTYPKTQPAQPKNIIWCYLLAFAIGAGLHAIANAVLQSSGEQLHPIIRIYMHDFVGAVSIILLLVASVWFAIPHAPAAGMALVLTFDVNSVELATILLAWVFILAGCKHLLRRRLVNLWD